MNVRTPNSCSGLIVARVGAGQAKIPHSSSTAASQSRAWGGAGAPTTPFSAAGSGVCMADILGESSAGRSAGPARTASDSAARATGHSSSGHGGGVIKKKGSRSKGVKLTLDEFQAAAVDSSGGMGATTSGGMLGMHAERFGAERSNAPAWGRPRASDPVDTSVMRITPPSLSAIMTDERSKLKQQSESAASQNRSNGVNAQHVSAIAGPSAGGPRGKGGRAWGQTQDLSEIRQAMIEEALFQRASQLPDIRPTGNECSWGRTHATEVVSIAKIEDIQMEEQDRRLSASVGGRGGGGAAAPSPWVNSMPRRASLQHVHAPNASGAQAAAELDSVWPAGGDAGARMGQKGKAGESGRGGGGTAGRASGRGGRGRGAASGRGSAGGVHGAEELCAQGGDGGRGRGGSRGRGGRGGRGKQGGKDWG